MDNLTDIAEIRPYSFADFLAMKPGTLLGGFMHIGDSWHIGPEWVFQAGDIYPHGRSRYSLTPILEYRVNWRRKLREYSRKVSRSRLYRPSQDGLEAGWRSHKNTMKIEFEVGKPIGLYLGHILRCNSVSLVNVLSPEGYDIWI
jgi:hypothetical protein